MSALEGTGQLARLNFRRDRIMLPSWVYLLTAVAVGVAYSSKATFSTLAKQLTFASGVNDNPAMLAMYGPVRDPSSIGSVSIWKVCGIATALVGVMSVLLTVRHTRADEEAGRLELVSAGVVGRYAALSAGLLTAVTANVVVMVLVGAGLIAVGLPVIGSVAFALGWFAVGAMFIAVAALAAQLATGSRAANGIGLSVLGLSYLIRAVGDAAGDDGPTWLTWLSPLGWVNHLQPYAGERWWVLGLAAAFTVVCLAAAFRLAGRRDLGAGLLPDRLGPADAVAGLRSPLALAWRLERGALLAWTAGFAVYAAMIGSVTDSIGDMLDTKSSRDIIAKLGGHNEGQLADGFLSTGMAIMALVAAAYAVQAVLRLRAEETRQLAEPLLATKVGRAGWATSRVVFAVVGPAILMAVVGLITGAIHGARTHDIGTQLPRVLWSALVQLPAVWVLAGITVALFGLAPRLAMAAWGALGLFLLVGELGPLLKLKQWMMDVSPFTHVPRLPGAQMRTTPLIWLVTVAAALTAIGYVGLRRRDIG
jgi:ABC-2 type transport system permease protein